MLKQSFFAVLVAMLVIAGCGNKKNSIAESDALQSEAASISDGGIDQQLMAEDAHGLQMSLASVYEQYIQLVAEGEAQAAADLAKEAQEWISANADELETIGEDESALSVIIEQVKSLPTKVSEDAEDAVDELGDNAEKAKEAAKSTVEDAVNKLLNQ